MEKQFSCKYIIAMIALTCGASAYANDFTANVSASNNYIWRGLTQTENEPAVSGGLDYVHESGFYIGTWASNLSFALK